MYVTLVQITNIISVLVIAFELELELYFYLNTVNLSDKIIIIKKLQSTLIYINMI